MTYRFEEEDFKNTYVLEDYYCTNPFCDCNHVTLCFTDQENAENRITFLMNFNKTSSTLPNQPKMTKVQSEIVKGFVKDFPDELLVLFKQRYMEAKAHGERHPMSYLVCEPGRYVNYIEMFPRNQEMLDFSYGNEKYFVEDSYDVDPRNDNKDIRMAIYKHELDSQKQSPLFNYTYYFNESAREKEDARLKPADNDMIMALNETIPNLYDILKERYRKAKKIGEELIKAAPNKTWEAGKIRPNDPCPCGSGKKFKKCCQAKPN